IRGLLDKYYRAITSTKEEEMLETFFREVNPDDIPEDLASERKMFVLMGNIHSSKEDRILPDYLMEQLENIVERPVVADGHRKKFHNLLLYIGGSVAACILIAFIIVFMHQHKDDSPGVKVLAETQQNSDSPILINSEEEPICVPVVENKVSEVEIPVDKHEVMEEDGFIEITDPEEAREILQNIGKLLAQNAVDTNDAIVNISSSIDSYKEISKSILQ
ncbi:MAG: hypothetical protein K2K23_04950, partial [Muribaculaceae bacterium]|nr:hypothetical protein [Muribaculaceae bacterium]